jgi:hypothetical protein
LQQLFSSVTSGTAEMAKNSILTDGEIASGLVLTAKRILRQKQFMWIMMMFKKKYPII